MLSVHLSLFHASLLAIDGLHVAHASAVRGARSHQIFLARRIGFVFVGSWFPAPDTYPAVL